MRRVLRDPARLFLAATGLAAALLLAAAWVLSGRLVLIAHAGGSADGEAMTNSLRAMSASAARGIGLIEIDLSRLADGSVVCAHDWDAFGGTPPEAAAWREAHRDGPRPCTAETAGAWLRQNPGAVIVTDVKADQLGVLAALSSAGWPKDRTVVQIYAPDEAGPVRALGFERQILTLYRYDEALAPVVALAGSGRLEAVTMPTYRVRRGEARTIGRTGVPVYTHTVNRWAPAGYYALFGVSGVYTDNTEAPSWHPFARRP